jgi:hypothetical protein
VSRFSLLGLTCHTQVYPDPVRVVAIGKSVEALLSAPGADDNMASSVEFCGGTHLNNTAQVGVRAPVKKTQQQEDEAGCCIVARCAAALSAPMLGGAAGGWRGCMTSVTECALSSVSSVCSCCQDNKLRPICCHRTPNTQAKAFALLSEEGIAKGVRRIVAVTAADAAAAIAEGDALAADVEKAAALPDAELEQVKRRGGLLLLPRVCWERWELVCG